MKKVVSLIAIALPFASMVASAEVVQFTPCTLNEGKTIADVQAWVSSWRMLVKQAGKQYTVRILVPHASPERSDQFYLEGTSPTLSSYAAAWEWWYADPNAAKSNTQLMNVAQCGAQSIYVTAD